MVKVGRLIYLNSAPLYYGIDHGLVSLDLELIPGLPSELNRMMAEGKLDLSPISAIEYARHQDQYLLLPDLCLNSDGMVKSVLLISRKKIDDLNNSRIALTRTSATSQALLKIMMSDKYKAKIHYTEMEPDPDKMLQSNDAVLLIGDDALLIEPSDELIVYDLGQLWKDYSGYPVIFVVFAVQRILVRENPDKIIKLNNGLMESLNHGLKNLDEFAGMERYRPIARKIGMKDYFKNLNFQFNRTKVKALLFYYQQASQLGLCPECHNLEFTHSQSEMMEKI